MPTKDIALGNPYQLFVDGSPITEADFGVIGHASKVSIIDKETLPSSWGGPSIGSFSFSCEGELDLFSRIVIHRNTIKRYGVIARRWKNKGKILRWRQYKEFMKIAKCNRRL